MGDSFQGVMALLRQYSRKSTGYGIDLLLQTGAHMVGVDQSSFTTVSYCMGLLLMKTLPSIFVNFLLCKIGYENYKYSNTLNKMINMNFIVSASIRPLLSVGLCS